MYIPVPGLHLAPHFGQAGDHFGGDTQILVNSCIHGIDHILVVINLVMTSAAALIIAEITLDGA